MSLNDNHLTISKTANNLLLSQKNFKNDKLLNMATQKKMLCKVRFFHFKQIMYSYLHAFKHRI